MRTQFLNATGREHRVELNVICESSCFAWINFWLVYCSSKRTSLLSWRTVVQVGFWIDQTLRHLLSHWQSTLLSGSWIKPESINFCGFTPFVCLNWVRSLTAHVLSISFAVRLIILIRFVFCLYVKCDLDFCMRWKNSDYSWRAKRPNIFMTGFCKGVHWTLYGNFWSNLRNLSSVRQIIECLKRGAC